MEMHREKPSLDQIRLLRLAQAQRAIGLAHCQIQLFIGEDQLDLNIRIKVEELRHPLGQPPCPEPDRCGDTQHACRLVLGFRQPRLDRLELQSSRDGWVKVICEGPANADCSATLTSLEGQLKLAHVPVTKIGQGSKVVLEMKLTDEGRALLASASNRVPAVLETAVTDSSGPVCRNVFSSILTGPMAP